MATSDKYDRQLRLWGSNGQKLLSSASILLIKADAVGTETLKNLVLPGVGSFTILDDFIVSHSDLGSNFFTSELSLGKPRAEVVTELLCEMNNDVQGYSRVANFQNVFQTEPEYFARFDIIIAANLPSNQLLPLANFCWKVPNTEGPLATSNKTTIPLIYLRSYGLIGSIRLQLREHSIIESKLENDPYDLRITNPFPGLVQYCDSFEISKLKEDSFQHAHMPYILILYKAIAIWQAEHDGRNPTSSAEKSAFKDTIRAMSRDYENEINFQEAVRESYRAYTRKEYPEELSDLLNTVYSSSTENLLSQSCSDFNWLLRALSIFAQNYNGQLPLHGQIPDLTSSTEMYVELQRVYQLKAQQDLQAFKEILSSLLLTSNRSSDAIPNETIEVFCKNAYGIMVMTTSSILEEQLCDGPISNSTLTTSASVQEVLQCDLYQDPVQTPIIWYLGLRAADLFYHKYARWPGDTQTDITLQTDEVELFSLLRHVSIEQLAINPELIDENYYDKGIYTKMSLENDEVVATNKDKNDADESKLISMDHAIELTRYGGIELHNISALIGGIAAQEAVKIITHQYVPLNNTYIFNGIAGCGATYNL